ncbi:MAG: tetratricopeptide repeat protein [Myxococcaceae bacterium]|nr:tetratricopeptide repeat protein [Myxococcaceae bacterium]
MLNDWDIDGARRELEAAEKVAPKDAEPVRYFRGRVLFEEGRYADAIKELEAAGVRDKPGSWLRLVKDTARITEKYERQESDHFIFTYPPGKDAVLAPWALDAIESMAKAMEADLGFRAKGKVRIEIVSNARELAAVSTLTKKQIQDTGTIAICKFNKLMVTSPKALVHGYDWLDTVSHEYVHYAVSNVSRNTVPIWLHEGLAKYLESRWRGPYGAAMTPSTLALLGSRVRANTLVPFEKMHPSMALLPTAEDAATAFAEVYFAVDLLFQREGSKGLKELLQQMATGESDQKSVAFVYKAPFPQFEKAWLAHVKKQPFPKELIPRSQKERTDELVAGDGEKKDEKKKKRDVSFGDFKEVEEVDARRWAHLGELMREHNRGKAAAEHFQLAWNVVKDRYESISNKYALTLLELKRYDEAEKVLRGSLTMHPGSGPTSVHLGRILLRKADFTKARDAYLDALAVNPFDPEVHLALYLCFDKLGDAKMKARAQAGFLMLMPKIDPKKLPELAREFAKDDDLSHVDIGEPPAPVAKDAG